MDNRRSSYDGFLTKQYDPLAVKADAEKGLLTGYASKFWVVDSYAEATAPGAFAKTIADRGPQASTPRILLRYEHEVTIGTHRKMAEDATGLAIEAKISDDGMYGTAVRRQLADEVPYGLSIGFRRLRDRSAEDDDPLDFSSAPDWVKTLPRNEIRILTETKLAENSVVSFPAVDPALVDSYRSERSLDYLKTFVTDLKAGRLSPDQRQLLAEIVAAAQAAAAPEGDETSTPPRRTAKTRRNYLAELALLGIPYAELV